jgi:hypothetical protein
MGEGWVKGAALGKGGLDWPLAWVDGFQRGEWFLKGACGLAKRCGMGQE